MNKMTIREVGKAANLRVWSQRVAECRGSGMPVSRWCQENGISYKTYYRWQKKVFEAMVEEHQNGPRFARVSAQQPENNVAATVRIGPASVDVYTGADAETVAAIMKALTYLKNQWQTLTVFLKDGRIELSNNRAERSFKLFVISRKNFLFTNTPDGARTSTVLFSFIEISKENDQDPYKYLTWALEEASCKPAAELVPWKLRQTCG